MNSKGIAYLLFAVGVILLEVHTTFAVFWQLLRGSAPYPPSQSVILYYAQGFTPILGALCLLVSGLIYGNRR